MADINPNSEEIFPNAFMEAGFAEVKRRAPWPASEGESNESKEAEPESVRFQAMRIAYYCEDKTSTVGKPVLNRIVTLKEDPGKS